MHFLLDWLFRLFGELVVWLKRERTGVIVSFHCTFTDERFSPLSCDVDTRSSPLSAVDMDLSLAQLDHLSS